MIRVVLENMYGARFEHIIHRSNISSFMKKYHTFKIVNVEVL